MSTYKASSLPLPDERLRFLLQHSPTGFAMFDREMRYLEASKRWCEVFGASSGDELRGRSFYEVFPETPAEWRQAHQRGLRGEVVRKERERFQRASGVVEWISWEVRPWHDASGEVGGISVFAEDVSGQVALRNQENLTQSIIGSAMDAIISVDEEQRILIFNRAAELTFHCTAEQVLGTSLSRFVPTEFRAAHQEHIRRFGATGITTRSVKAPKRLEAVRFDGERFPIEATISQSEVDGGRIYTVILRDMTERLKTEEAMLRAERLASAGRIAAALAHEVNNPLASVTNALYLISTGELPEMARHYLSIADEELKRIAHMTRQSLGFYRENGTPAPTSVPEVIDSAIEVMKSKIQQKQARVQKDWGTDLQVTAVAGELRQVMANLLANSLDALSSGGTIRFRYAEVKLRNGRPGVRITVADDGQGFSPEARPHIFEPFFTTKGDLGTGLGLWVCRQLVEKHGGVIRARSWWRGANRGTCFQVELPVESPAHAGSEAAS